MTDRDIFGFSQKTWAKIILCTSVAMVILFIVLPYLISLFLPLVCPDKLEDYQYLVDMLDGIAIVVGIVGTVASIISIFMTIADKKRYNLEKKQTEDLVNSVNELHKEIRIVDTCVKQTFEHNQKLALELYNKSIIDVNLTENLCFGISTENHNRNWGNKTTAGEIEVEQ